MTPSPKKPKQRFEERKY